MADNVFINGRAAIHQGSAGKSIAFPDVCLCPPGPPAGPIPVPLVNTAQAADLQGGAVSVTIEGKPVAHNESYIAKSTGNEVARSTGGGVITQQVQGRAYFQTFSMNVFIESKPAVRHLDLVTHNHLTKIPGNTPPTPWLSATTAGPGPVPKELEKDANEGKEWIEIALRDPSGNAVAGAVPRDFASRQGHRGRHPQQRQGQAQTPVQGPVQGRVVGLLPREGQDPIGQDESSVSGAIGRTRGGLAGAWLLALLCVGCGKVGRPSANATEPQVTEALEKNAAAVLTNARSERG
jgi:hypothetical protein